jgi:hypothetical protein
LPRGSLRWHARRARYATRYFPGETLHLDGVEPQSRADIVIENTDPHRARLLI